MEGFGKRLTVAMNYRGKTQQDIADNCNIDKGNLSKYISGKLPMPKQSTIKRIADYLDVDEAFLMGLSDSVVKQVIKVHQGIFEPTEEELLIKEITANITWLTLEEMRMFNSMIKTLIKDRK